MCSLQIILEKIVEKIVETVFQSVGRHVGFILHYKRNLKNVEDEVNNLQKQRSSVQGKVDEAHHRGEAIKNNVLDWLKDADETRQGVDNLRDEKTVKENMLCFNLSCPNFISRYRLSKQAGKVVVDVKHVIEEGGKIENGTVSHPREAPPELEFPSSKDYEGFDSRDKVFKDIVKALKDPEVNRIGVYGTGGVGKTTIVTKVGELVKKDGTFDEVVMAVVSKDVNVIKIQGQLADLLNPRLDLTLSGETEMGRAAGLWNRLNNGKKNLILLDDVWQQLDLNKIGIPISDGNKSCKVVLTARNRDVWKNMDVDKDFKIEILIEKESWALFQKKVGNYVNNDQELREIAWAVCKECQGLPVAINAIGAALKNKDMYAWRDALDKLQNSMLNDIEGIDRQVYASLKWSYDRLDSEDAKSCFLLCCLFPEDDRIPIDDLVRYYMAGRTFHHDQKPDSLERALYRVRTVVSTLISCCLLLDENYDQDVVKMHDVVRDVAISIAKGEKYSFLVKHDVKDWPEKATYEQCSVISLGSCDMREFPDELVCPSLNTLRLDCTNDVSRLQVPDRFFSGTENLMVLDLKSVTMSPILPASLAKLAKLQMLCLDGCKLGDIAILKDLKDHLEILSLRRSDIEVLPPEVGELTRLRVLDMNDCAMLEVIPKGVISKLLRLEELYMPWKFSQWEETRADGTGRDKSRVSLDELMSLTRLTTLYVRIGDPALLPKDFAFENLVRFNIAMCDVYAWAIYDKDSTGVLQLEKIHVANVLESLLGKPKPKWSIQRNGLYPSTSFYHLTYLSIKDCRLKYLFSPSSARGLVQLKKLVIERCMDMEGVIGNEGEEDHEDIIPISFSRLNELSLEDLPNLKSFYRKKEKKATSSESCSTHDAKTVLFTDKVILPVLKILNISTVGNIVEIWDKQSIAVLEDKGSFCQLTDVSINYCDKLLLVFPSKIHLRLKNLEKLWVGSCAAMEGIVEFEGEIYEDGLGNEICFSKLSRLELFFLPNLVGFCTKLRTAGTTDGNATIHAQPLFNEKVIFPVLEILTIVWLDNIIKIWDNQSIAVVEDGLRNEVASPALEHLEMFGAPKTTEIQNKQPIPQPRIKVESLCKLERIEIWCCNQLLYVFPSNMLPQNLQRLEIVCCDGLEVIFSKELKEKEAINYDIIVFPQLKEVTLRNLPKLKSFYTETQGFFSHKVAFPVLESLEIENLDKITRIWDNQPLSEPEKEAKSFCQLMGISVSCCVHLEYVLPYYMLPQLKNLQRLAIWGCTKMEVIIISNNSEDQKEATIDDTILFPQLETVVLNGLPNLKSLCTETQLFFSNKDAFPVLETIILDPKGTLEFLRNEMAFTKEVSMEECGTSGKENDHNGEQG